MKLPNDINRGDPITARWLNAVKNAVIGMIRVGPGLTMTASGGRVVIGLARQPRPVRRGGGGGILIPVYLTVDGGDGGSVTTQCNYTYTIREFSEGLPVLATNLTPLSQRHPVGRMISGGTKNGIAYKDPFNGEWRLLWANEILQTQACLEEPEP